MAGQRRRSTIDVDADGFLAGLAAAFEQLELQTERDLLRLALDVQNRARLFCPVDTGRLRASIQLRRSKDALGPYIDVGSNVTYAPYVEFGTSRAAAQPFMRPALAEAIRSGLRRRGTGAA